MFVSRLRAVTAHRILFRDWETFGLGMHARKARQQVPSLDESGRIRAGSALRVRKVQDLTQGRCAR